MRNERKGSRPMKRPSGNWKGGINQHLAVKAAPISKKKSASRPEDMNKFMVKRRDKQRMLAKKKKKREREEAERAQGSGTASADGPAEDNQKDSGGSTDGDEDDTAVDHEAVTNDSQQGSGVGTEATEGAPCAVAPG